MDKKGCRNTEKPEEFCKFANEDKLPSKSETATRGSATENDIFALQKCKVEDGIILGQIVISNAGHDKDSHLVVIGREGENFVFVADGRLRTVEKPKKKKLRHVLRTNIYFPKISEKILQGVPVTNAELRKIIAEFKQSAGGETTAEHVPNAQAGKAAQR